jgi:hypothetical protein
MREFLEEELRETEISKDIFKEALVKAFCRINRINRR